MTDNTTRARAFLDDVRSTDSDRALQAAKRLIAASDRTDELREIAGELRARLVEMRDERSSDRRPPDPVLNEVISRSRVVIRG